VAPRSAGKPPAPSPMPAIWLRSSPAALAAALSR
jgi:hypothetical protein